MPLCITYLNILINLTVSFEKLFTSLEQIGPHRKIIFLYFLKISYIKYNM